MYVRRSEAVKCIPLRPCPLICRTGKAPPTTWHYYSYLWAIRAGPLASRYAGWTVPCPKVPCMSTFRSGIRSTLPYASIRERRILPEVNKSRALRCLGGETDIIRSRQEQLDSPLRSYGLVRCQLRRLSAAIGSFLP